MSLILTGTKWTYQQVKNKNTIFLAGPSKGSDNNFVSYRKKFVELVNKEIPDCVIFNPEYEPSGGNANVEEILSNSQEWELNAINSSKVIIIGLDTDTDALGLNIRTEFEFLILSRKNLVVYAPPGIHRCEYMAKLARRNIICETLEKVVKKTKEFFQHKPYVNKSKRSSNIEIYANNCDPIVLRETLTLEEENNKESAIWCFIDTNDFMNYFLLTNIKSKYKFHHGNNKVMAFYKWNNAKLPDMVHTFDVKNMKKYN